jgi:16S rRNA processing protein RimM
MGQDRFLTIGEITNVHGLRGEVTVYPWCDSAAFLCSFDTLYFDNQGRKPVRILHARVHKNMAILQLEGITTREQAETLRRQQLFMDREDVELDEGCYFIQDLIGLEVRDADTGEVYGEIADVLETGANDVYVISCGEGVKEKLVPAIPDVIIETNLEDGYMTIRPLKGLFDDAD